MRQTAREQVRRTKIARAAALAAAFASLAVGTVRGQQMPAGTVPVAEITIEGNQRVDEAIIQSALGIRVGDLVGVRELDRAISGLWATGQFKDVDLLTVSDSLNPSAPIRLRVVVQEQPLVSSIDFLGLEHVSAGAVRDSAGLRSGSPFRPGRVNQAVAVVRSLLSKKGFRPERVEHELVPIEGRDNEVRLLFRVDEGQRVAIADVQFEGNEAFSDDELRSAMRTKSEAFLWTRTGSYDEAKLQTDLRASLPELYARNGYLDFSVVGDSLVVDPESGKGIIIIAVLEGPEYILAEFDVRGNRRFASEDLRRYFEEESGGLFASIGLASTTLRRAGDPFDAIAFQNASTSVEQLYANTGYIYAQVNPSFLRLPPSEEGGQPRVQAIWNITEGSPAFINEVRVVGNTYTHEDVIRSQLLTLPGDLYSQDLVLASYQRISALGFFEAPLPNPDIVPTETGDVDITYRVIEKQTGSVNFGTTLGGYSGLAGFLGYDQPNLFGQAKSGHLRWEFGQFSNNFEASYTDPSILGTRYSGSLSLFSSRDRFFTFQEGRRRRTGVGMRFGVPFWLDRRDTRLNVGYSVSRTVYEEFEDEQQSSLFSLPPGVQSTLTLGLTRSNIDHPVFPTVGSRQEFEVSVNGGFLGGDGTFQKYTFASSWYVPVGTLGGDAPGSRPARFTLGLSLEAGAIVGDASRFPFERFWMGGVQFGKALRGYDETTITPRGYIPREADVPLDVRFGDAYLRMSAEYALRVNDNISLNAFYDAGNVWNSFSEVNPTRLARGAGVGITLVTPFGPLGLDYAYGFDRRPPSWQLHFKFGQGF